MTGDENVPGQNAVDPACATEQAVRHLVHRPPITIGRDGPPPS